MTEKQTHKPVVKGELTIPVPKPFSEELSHWLRSDQTKTLTELSDVFGDRTFAIIFLILMATSALPIPTAGITDIFAIITIIFAAQMMFGLNKLWLPKRWKNMRINKTLANKLLPKLAKFIKKIEGHSKPRLTTLFDGRISNFILGLTIATFALSTIIAPPFSGLDTLPAMGAVLLGLSIILKDGYFAIIGWSIGTTGILLQIFLARAVTDFVKGLF